MGIQLPSAPHAVCLCVSCSLCSHDPTTQKAQFSHGAQGKSPMALCGISNLTITGTPKAMRPSYQKPNTQPYPWPVDPFCLFVAPKTLGYLALLLGPHGLRPVYLWLDTIMRRLSQIGEKAPIPRATFLGEATQ